MIANIKVSSEFVPPESKKILPARLVTLVALDHFVEVMNSSTFHFKHFLALLLALIPLAAVVGACVACP